VWARWRNRDVDATTKMLTIKMADGVEQKGQFPTQPSDRWKWQRRRTTKATLPL